MGGFLKDLIKIGITAGLSDRETFVKKVSGIIEQVQHNPEQADELAKSAVDYMEQLKDDLRMQSSIRSSINDANLPGKESIEELTKAIKKLTEELQHAKGSK